MNVRRQTTVKTKKNTRFTLNLTDPKVKEFAREKAERKFDNNLSLYVRTLIRADMEREKAA